MIENKKENLHDRMIEKWLEAFVVPLFKKLYSFPLFYIKHSSPSMFISSFR